MIKFDKKRFEIGMTQIQDGEGLIAREEGKDSAYTPDFKGSSPEVLKSNGKFHVRLGMEILRDEVFLKSLT